jgi:hypothetical protein
MIRYGRRFIDPRNQYRRWIDPRVRTLPVGAVIAYLQRRGWMELPTDRQGFLVFQEPTGTGDAPEAFVQFVPEGETEADYALRMFELITGLAEFENRQASEVIDDILKQAHCAPANGASGERARSSTHF